MAENERVALEAQLNASVRMQIENTREGIRRLGTSQEQITAVRDSIARVSDYCEEADRLIENYPFIKLVSRCHANFCLTRLVYDEFCALDEKVRRTAQLLEEDRRERPDEPANLLVVYYYLARLCDFRSQTMSLMQDAPQTVIFTLRRYFKPLDDLEQEFEDFFWKLPRSLFFMAVKGQKKTLLHIAKVLSRMDVASKARFNSIVDDGVMQKFQTALSLFSAPPSSDPEGALGCIEFWKSDLAVIRDQLAPCFPPNQGIMDFFILSYHRNVHSLLSRCLQPNSPATVGIAAAGSSSATNANRPNSPPAAAATAIKELFNKTVASATGKDQQQQQRLPALSSADLLFILRWTRTYYETMQTEFSLTIDDLEPRLLDHRDGQLIGEYVKISRQKLHEWIGTLFNSEKRAFIERTAAPELDPQNHYYSPAAVDLIQIIKQHILSAASASKGRLVLEIVVELGRTVGDFQKNLSSVLAEERTRYFAAQSNEAAAASVAANFEDYTIMLGNTALRWAASLQQEIVDQLEELVEPEHLPNCTKQMRTLGDGFVGIAKGCVSVLVDVIMQTIQPALSKLFTASWYREQGQLVQQITATFADYFEDYRTHCDEFLMNKLVGDCLDRLIAGYLEQMQAKTTKLRMGSGENTNSLFQSDLATISGFFRKLRDEKRVQKAMDVLDKTVALVVSSPKMIFLEFFAVWKVYPDMPLAFLENVLFRRDDLDKQTIRDLMETCRRKTQEEKVIEVAPSIFSKLAKT